MCIRWSAAQLAAAVCPPVPLLAAAVGTVLHQVQSHCLSTPLLLLLHAATLLYAVATILVDIVVGERGPCNTTWDASYSLISRMTALLPCPVGEAFGSPAVQWDHSNSPISDQTSPVSDWLCIRCKRMQSLTCVQQSCGARCSLPCVCSAGVMCLTEVPLSAPCGSPVGEANTLGPETTTNHLRLLPCRLLQGRPLP